MGLLAGSYRLTRVMGLLAATCLCCLGMLTRSILDVFSSLRAGVQPVVKTSFWVVLAPQVAILQWQRVLATRVAW